MDVLKVLRESPNPLTDEELASLLGREVRSVSQECRGLAFRGLVIRDQAPSGPVFNRAWTED